LTQGCATHTVVVAKQLIFYRPHFLNIHFPFVAA
jgi:hypothetical protein